jgi:hypothetical protein
VGLRGRSGQVRKISLPPGFDPRTVQAVGSRYTSYATRPTKRGIMSLENSITAFHSTKSQNPADFKFLEWLLFLIVADKLKKERKKPDRIVSQLATQIDGRRGRGRKVLFKLRHVSTRLHDIISYIKHKCQGHRRENLKFVDISTTDYTLRGSSQCATAVHFSVHILCPACHLLLRFSNRF